MRLSLLICCAAFSTALTAVETVGPFNWSTRFFDPADPRPAAIARDGMTASAALLSGDVSSGVVQVQTWSGDTEAGGRGADSISLFAPPGGNAFVGLRQDWSIREGADGGTGSWIYYTKFQQDTVTILGIADCAPAALNKAPGTDFALQSALPYNRLMLVLPWRWVQGGGSTYQRGDHRGAPLEAGVFAVPAGMSLAQAQADSGTWRLAGLDQVLSEIQPHLWSTSFRLLALKGGRWQVAIDIDSDGQIDVITDSSAAGHQACPFPDLDERSGLIISTVPAGGSRSGTVGRSTTTLSYRTIPANLPGWVHAADFAFGSINRRPFQANVHPVVKSSPTIIDGTAWGESYQVTALASTLGPNPMAVARIGTTNQWFIDQPLDPQAQTQVTFAQTGSPTPSTITAAIDWAPLDMYRDEAVTIRVGDSIKLQANTFYTDSVSIDADADGTVDYTGLENDIFVHRYTTAGVYLAKAYNLNGEEVGTATVTVTEVRLPKAIACQVGFRRTVDIHTGVNDPKNLFFTANDPSLMTVTRGPTAHNHVRIMIKALRRGTPILQIRQGGASGPILACKEVDEFFLNTEHMLNLVVNSDIREAGSLVVLQPFIPNLELQLEMFANTASFLTGKFHTVNTDAFDVRFVSETGENSGSYHLNLVVPRGESSFCMRGSISQENQQRVVCGETGQINGDGCEAIVDKLYLLKNNERDLPVRIVKHPTVEGNANAPHPDHDIIIQDKGGADEARWKSGGKLKTAAVDCNADPLPYRVQGLTVAAGSQVLKYDVTIGQTTWTEAIVVGLENRTVKHAPDGTPDSRLEVGVWEEVEFKADDFTSITWEASGGSPRTGSGTPWVWRAPRAQPAEPITITASYDGQTEVIKITVIRPAAVAWTNKVRDEPSATYGTGAGAGMYINRLDLGPDHVCFGNLRVKELSGPAENITGIYNDPLWLNEEFADESRRIYHRASGVYIPINDTNISDERFEDFAGRRGSGMPDPLVYTIGGEEKKISYSAHAEGSGFDWTIPMVYLPKGDRDPRYIRFGEVLQTIRLAQDGQYTVTKTNKEPCTASRSVGEVVPPDPDPNPLPE